MNSRTNKIPKKVVFWQLQRPRVLALIDMTGIMCYCGKKSIVSQQFKAIDARYSPGQPLRHPLTSTAENSGGAKQRADCEASAFIIFHISFTVQSLGHLSCQKTLQKWGKCIIVSSWQQYLLTLAQRIHRISTLGKCGRSLFASQQGNCICCHFDESDYLSRK